MAQLTAQHRTARRPPRPPPRRRRSRSSSRQIALASPSGSKGKTVAKVDETDAPDLVNQVGQANEVVSACDRHGLGNVAGSMRSTSPPSSRSRSRSQQSELVPGSKGKVAVSVRSVSRPRACTQQFALASGSQRNTVAQQHDGARDHMTEAAGQANIGVVSESARHGCGLGNTAASRRSMSRSPARSQPCAKQSSLVSGSNGKALAKVVETSNQSDSESDSVPLASDRGDHEYHAGEHVQGGVSHGEIHPRLALQSA